MWFKNTVSNCFWKYTGDKITVGETVLETNNIICRIPKDDRYLDKYVWNKLPNDEMGNYFTLGQGDIIIKGEVDDEVNEAPSGSDYPDGFSHLNFGWLEGEPTEENFVNTILRLFKDK